MSKKNGWEIETVRKYFLFPDFRLVANCWRSLKVSEKQSMLLFGKAEKISGITGLLNGTMLSDTVVFLALNVSEILSKSIQRK